MNNMCIVCLVSESSSRLFLVANAQSEDSQNYQAVTGIKLKCPALLCQRCSIDLGYAATIKTKAIASSKALQLAPNTQRLITVTNKTGSNIKAPAKAPLTNLISTKVVVPPINPGTIASLFATKPNVTLIKCKDDSDIKNSAFAAKRRNSVCVTKYYEQKKKDEKVSNIPANTRSKRIAAKAALENIHGINQDASDTKGKKPAESKYKQNIKRVSAPPEIKIPIKKSKVEKMTEANNKPNEPADDQVAVWYNIDGVCNTEVFDNKDEADKFMKDLPEGTPCGLLED